MERSFGFENSVQYSKNRIQFKFFGKQRMQDDHLFKETETFLDHFSNL